MSIEKLLKGLSPDHSKLIINGEEITSTIFDEELDPLKCEFHNDNCVYINTDDYSYITLSIDNLYELIDMISDSEAKYKQILTLKK
tara:strand:- start:255 stop:512 length:258 start_codon:yes stop_codon:yes gene_type:complete